MPETIVRIHGQDKLHRGGRVRMQEQMPAALAERMRKADYEELRRLVDEGLAPLNQAVKRVSPVMRFCCVPPRACLPFFAFTVLPCLLMYTLLKMPEAERKILLVSLVAVLSVFWLVEFGLRVAAEEYIYRANQGVLKDIKKTCRKFARGKNCVIAVRTEKVGGNNLWFPGHEEFYLGITETRQDPNSDKAANKVAEVDANGRPVFDPYLSEKESNIGSLYSPDPDNSMNLGMV